MYNEKSLLNLKAFDSQRAKECGRIGGIKSGITRKKYADIKKKYRLYFSLKTEINQLSKMEFEKFVMEYTIEQQQRIYDFLDLHK